jgi:hypothetical protein
MIHLISKYLLVSAIASGCFVVFILWAIKTAIDRRDSSLIYQFLRRNVEDGQCRFRSSEAISAVTSLSVSRIADLCTKHPHVEQKAHERHTWRVVNTVETDEPAAHFREL